MKIKEVIIVEGKSDRLKIEQAVKADTIETNGSALDERTLEKIKHAAQKRGIIVFTDPDHAGERIRAIIQEHVPDCKHAFLPKDQAKSTKAGASLGIEHASVEHIREALAGVYQVFAEEKSPISQADLISLGLIGQATSQRRRQLLGERLKIGHPNGKQLLKRLTIFQITKEQLIDAVEWIEEEENHGL